MKEDSAVMASRMQEKTVKLATDAPETRNAAMTPVSAADQVMVTVMEMVTAMVMETEEVEEDSFHSIKMERLPLT